MALTQLGQIAMFTTDLIMLGRLGPAAVAAASLAHTVFFAVFVIGMGVVSAVAPLAAQAYGAGKPDLVRRTVRVGLWSAVGFGLPLTISQMWAGDLLTALGQAPEATELASLYLQGLSWCLIPCWIFIALRGFMGAVDHPAPALWITLAAIPLNAALAFALIYGAAGLPPYGVLGAGIATSLVNTAMSIAAIAVSYAGAPFKRFRILANFWRLDPALLRELTRVGIPMSGAFILEFGLFAAAALLMGHIGTAELAAHQVAIQVASILFMVPFGIGLAATVRVGHAVGARDAAASRSAATTALLLGVGFMVVMMAVVLALRARIPLLFLSSEDAAARPSIELASTLLLVGGSFSIADAVQTIAAGALRGLSDTRIPLLFAGFSFWVVGFAAAWALAFQFGLGAVGVWIGLSSGVVLYAVLLTWRLYLLARRNYLPAVIDGRG